ncbi:MULTISPECIES: hypothetical protein [Hyphomonas]|uniref:hypothetical protein n=1 Tax=Hyphomonas TaxID=85 RepID=UPI0035112822
MIETLRNERERTSIGPQALLKGRDDMPEGLNAAMVTHWLGGRVKSVEKDHFAYVLKLWFAEPTNPTVQIDAALLDELRDSMKASGLTPEIIIRMSRDLPSGLTAGKMKSILSGTTRSARSDHIDYLKRVIGLSGSDASR